ncbi:MAG: CoA transferase [Acidobacteria bacterium]|nr:CoA transferase [Acidobacteriota bacterium]MBI3425530.1 CoA transferase [Acidobacteriota bacterium]
MQETASSPRPLAGLTVLDFTIALAGPFATLLLGGLGARVIKIENPLSGDTCRTNAPYLGAAGAKLARTSDDDISISALNRLRNKQGITLNLKHPQARELYADLLQHADIVVENFSSGVIDRLGVGYEFTRTINPRIIFCSISGFGSDGAGKALDTIIQALSGVMQTSGNAGEPPVRMGVPFADLITPLYGVIGILAALEQRRRTGVGQYVDVSMLGALTSLVAAEPFDLLERLGVESRTGQTVPRLAPFGIYTARDGHAAICAHTDAFTLNLFTAMARPDLAADERFNTRDNRVKHVAELDALIEAWTRTQPLAELLPCLEAAGVPAAEVRTPSVAVRDPRVLARGETVPLAHPKFGAVEEVYGTGLPIKFSAATAGFDQVAPALGEHNELVYGQMLGYSAEQIAQLKAEGII